MNGTRADNDNETVVVALNHILDVGSRLKDSLGDLFGAREFPVHALGGEERRDFLDVDVVGPAVHRVDTFFGSGGDTFQSALQAGRPLRFRFPQLTTSPHCSSKLLKHRYSRFEIDARVRYTFAVFESREVSFAWSELLVSGVEIRFDHDTLNGCVSLGNLLSDFSTNNRLVGVLLATVCMRAIDDNRRLQSRAFHFIFHFVQRLCVVVRFVITSWALAASEDNMTGVVACGVDDGCHALLSHG
mmetsp:Transcript_28106/g.49537  ORF Transcript_28106/g.49537 Transcript_28106/m.49537 type:complete len:244 (-) Transcript_28106:820-1551(-)